MTKKAISYLKQKYFNLENLAPLQGESIRPFSFALIFEKFSLKKQSFCFLQTFQVLSLNIRSFLSLGLESFIFRNIRSGFFRVGFFYFSSSKSHFLKYKMFFRIFISWNTRKVPFPQILGIFSWASFWQNIRSF